MYVYSPHKYWEKNSFIYSKTFCFYEIYLIFCRSEKKIEARSMCFTYYGKIVNLIHYNSMNNDTTNTFSLLREYFDEKSFVQQQFNDLEHMQKSYLYRFHSKFYPSQNNRRIYCIAHTKNT